MGADPNAHPLFGVTVPRQYHGGPDRLPNEQSLAGDRRHGWAIRASPRSVVRIRLRVHALRSVLFQATQRLDFEPEAALGRNRSVVLDLHVQELTTRSAKFTEPDIMRALAGAGADVRLPLKNGWTPLMLASGAGWRYAVWDRRERTLHKTPAFQAQMYDEAGTLDAVRFLLDRGAFVNAVDEDGNTALHYVVDKGFDGVVELLVEHGADLDIANRRGQTPYAIVARGRTGNIAAAPATVRLLESLGNR